MQIESLEAHYFRLTNPDLFDRIIKPSGNARGGSSLTVRRVVRVVEGAALEMLCSEMNPGFESLTLRQIKEVEAKPRLFLFCMINKGFEQRGANRRVRRLCFGGQARRSRRQTL